MICPLLEKSLAPVTSLLTRTSERASAGTKVVPMISRIKVYSISSGLMLRNEIKQRASRWEKKNFSFTILTPRPIYKAEVRGASNMSIQRQIGTQKRVRIKESN